ncbi:hypothetical protein A2U01_0076031, partial [Trifolium medium]|nr:hypothetical protein [Trifolium medium]
MFNWSRNQSSTVAVMRDLGWEAGVVVAPSVVGVGGGDVGGV